MRKSIIIGLIVIMLFSFTLAGNFAEKTYGRAEYVKLISNTDQCLVDCFTVYEVCNPTNKSIVLKNTFLINFQGKNVTAYSLDKISYTTTSYNETVCDEQACVKENQTVPATSICDEYGSCEETNETTELVDNCNCTSSHEVTIKKSTKSLTTLDLSKESILANSCFNISVSGKKTAMIGKNDVDNIVSYEGMNFTEYAWWNSSWTYSKRIDVNKTALDTGLVNFTILVNLNSSNFDFTHARTDGFDLRFTTADNLTELSFEREYYNSTTNVSYFWIKVPLINSSGNTSIYAYYGNSLATDASNSATAWDADQRILFHMNNATPTSIGDSTVYNDTATKIALNRPRNAVGKVHDAQDFTSSTSDYALTNTNLNVSNNFSVGMFVKRKTTGVTQYVMGTYNNSGGISGFIVGFNPANRIVYVINGTSYTADNTSIDTDWYYIMAIINESNYVRLYVNGEPVKAIQAKGTPVTRGKTYLGRGGSTTTGYYNGIIDELSISYGSKSSSWAKVNYHSLNNSLLSFGAEQKYSEAELPSITLLFPTNNSVYSTALLDVNFSAHDNYLIDQCWYEWNSVNYSRPNCNNFSTAFLSGGNNLTLYINDTSNNVNKSIPINFSISANTPTVDIVFPVNNSFYGNGVLNLSFETINEDNCRYKINTGSFTYFNCLNTTFTPVLLDNNFTLVINSSTGEQAEQNITFFISSLAGMNVEWTSPTPANNSFIAQNFSYNVISFTTQYASYKNYTIHYLYNSTMNIINTTMPSEISDKYTVNYTYLTDGIYYIIATGIDKVPQGKNVSGGLRKFVIDTIAPGITITYPTNNSFIGNRQITVNYSVTDANPSACILEKDGINSTIALESCPGGYVNESYGADGVYQVKIWSNDTVNHLNVSNTISFTIDTVPPGISLVYPTPNNNNRTKNTFVFVNASINEEYQLDVVTYFLYYANGTLINDVQTPDGYTNFTDLLDGTYLYNVSARDMALNINTTETRNITVDTTPPVFSGITSVPTVLTSKIDWYTNELGTDSLTYANNTDFTDSISIEGSSLATYHTQTITDLIANFTYFYKLGSCDDLNNCNTSIVRNFTTSITTVEILAPINNSYYSVRSIGLDYLIEGNNTNCYYTINTGSAVNLPDCLGATVSFVELENNLTIFANNSDNFPGSSTTTFFVSTGIGNLSFYYTMLQNNSFFNNNYIEIDLLFTMLNNNYRNHTIFYLYNNSLLVNTSYVYVLSGDIISFNFTGLGDGNYSVNATGISKTGAQNTTNVTNIVLDTLPPSIAYSGNSQADAVVTSSTSIFVNVTTNDLHYNFTTIFYYNSDKTINFSVNATVYNLTGLADSTYYWNVTSQDNATNKNTTSLYNITISTTAPAVTFSANTPSTGSKHPFTWLVINITAPTATTINLSIFNSTKDFVASATTLSNNFTSLPLGLYFFNATVTNVLGVKNVTETRNVTLIQNRIKGNVTNTTGDIIVGAQIVLVNHESKLAYSTTSNSTGHYIFDNLVSGNWTVYGYTNSTTKPDIKVFVVTP